VSSAITAVGVLGCGLMGSGIAQTAATAGYRTVVRDTADDALARGRVAVDRSLAKLVEKGALAAADRDAALGRLSFTTDLGLVADAGIVIEAVTENLDVKNGLWRELDGRCPAPTIFASNTSSLRIGSMAAAISRPDRMVGLHFFNPVPLMPLVEVVRGQATSAETFDQALAFARSLGKEPVASRDSSGFLVNRLLVPYLLDAVRALESGTGSVVDLDTAMRLGCGHPMGPLTLLDFVGLDTVVRIAEVMFDEYREPRFAPPSLLRRLVAAGHYGRKSGKGFYDYSVTPPVPVQVSEER
jgi:3-hydroxybutyryl-CoA dehydrogenase